MAFSLNSSIRAYPGSAAISRTQQRLRQADNGSQSLHGPEKERIPDDPKQDPVDLWLKPCIQLGANGGLQQIGKNQGDAPSLGNGPNDGRPTASIQADQ